MIRFALFMLFATAGLAQAQQVSDCSWEADLRNIVEPWSENTETFADGLVRLVKVTGPDAPRAPFKLLVLSPPYGENAARQCKVIAGGGEIGFSQMHIDQIEGAYDDAVGFMFSLPVVLYAASQDSETAAYLKFSLNNVTGQLIARIELGAN